VPPTLIPSTKSNPHFGHYSVKEAQELSKHAYQEAFEHKAEKILAYIHSHGKISRDETARLLFVSNNSAYLYLKRLVKVGKVKPTGRGKLIRYVRS
jgi:predicted HTH transcriptional regulator